MSGPGTISTSGFIAFSGAPRGLGQLQADKPRGAIADYHGITLPLRQVGENTLFKELIFPHPINDYNFVQAELENKQPYHHNDAALLIQACCVQRSRRSIDGGGDEDDATRSGGSSRQGRRLWCLRI